MSTVVVDASVALSWCFDDEASPETDAVLDQVRHQGAVVPGLWHVELTNVLLQAERRGRLTLGEVAEAVELISGLPIAVHADMAALAWREVLNLARAQRLTTYDATYLDLALRRGLPLATKDAALIQAAIRLGVPVAPGSR